MGACYGCLLFTAHAANEVGGTLITLSNTSTAPNGAWSWFEDERAIIDDSDPNNTKLLVSSVSCAAKGAERGDIDLLWLNIDTGVLGEFELHDQLEADDHDSAALLIRPDGRYVAMYARHGNDSFSRWRVSTNPNDPTSWGTEQTISNDTGTTYSNLHYLPNDNNGAGRTYNFTRATNLDPTILVSDDDGSTWTSEGYKLLTEGSSRDRPYTRYFSDGQKIHFTVTERHPRDFENNVYHGYIQDGQLFDSFGNLLDRNLFDDAARRPNELTSIFTTGTQIGGAVMKRAWTIDTAIARDGKPVTIFIARVNDDDDEHRMFYARFDGTAWNIHELAPAGGFLYSPENDYTGLASICPNDTATVFISTNIDPRNDQAMDHYEIFRGSTDDEGRSWNWEAVTFASTVDNLRPLVPAWNSTETVLVWMRGKYNNYQNWSCKVVALTDITPLETD